MTSQYKLFIPPVGARSPGKQSEFKHLEENFYDKYLTKSHDEAIKSIDKLLKKK